ncbi:SDR family oxidoreductase [Pragia fontium]|uniref:SDR family oxidoreductase n=1 Tax=Pragia fontium TaxID=82985 RepID=UPI00064B4345|nr:SDR family oxidoreductase [Pragia fontium]AKJ41694.1 short-chain dehydrogenase [Pragia fontium]
MKLKNTRILITGASGGIGGALAHALDQRGACLLLHGRNADVLHHIQQNLLNPECHQIVIADLCVDSERQKLVDAVAQLGGVDILINNAGINYFAWLENQSEHQIQQQLLLNIQAPILLTRDILPHLHKPGMIMNIGSSFGGIGYAGYSVYCASKFAIRGFSEALGRELAGTSIKVLHFAPRATQTTLNSAAVCAMNAELGTKSDSAEYVAQQVVCALEKERVRSWLGWPERFFVKLNALFPNLVDKALVKQRHVIARHAKVSTDKENLR